MSNEKNRQVYVRFHIRIDEAIDKASELAGLKRASLVSWIIGNHIRALNHKVERGELTLVSDMANDKISEPGITLQANLSQMDLSPASTLYHLKIGRTVAHAPRSIGKPILLTIEPEVESGVHLYAELCGMTVNQFRASIVASFLMEQGILK